MAKIKHTIAIKQALAKVDSRRHDIEEHGEKAIARAQTIAAIGHESSKDVATTIKEEITTKLARCMSYLEREVEAKLRGVWSSCVASQSIAELDAINVGFTELYTSINKNATEGLPCFVKAQPDGRAQ